MHSRPRKNKIHAKKTGIFIGSLEPTKEAARLKPGNINEFSKIFSKLQEGKLARLIQSAVKPQPNRSDVFRVPGSEFEV
jgi:hypothetical protein